MRDGSTIDIEVRYNDLRDFIVDADEFTYGRAVWLLREHTNVVLVHTWKDGKIVGSRTILA